MGRMIPIFRYQAALLFVALGSVVHPTFAQSSAASPRAARSMPPTRDPLARGYVAAKELPDRSNPSANTDGNFIIGPDYVATASSDDSATPTGTVIQFTMSSSDSKIYPGIARDEGLSER